MHDHRIATNENENVMLYGVENLEKHVEDMGEKNDTTLYNIANGCFFSPFLSALRVRYYLS